MATGTDALAWWPELKAGRVILVRPVIMTRLVQSLCLFSPPRLSVDRGFTRPPCIPAPGLWPLLFWLEW